MWQTEQFKNVHLTAVSFSGPLAYSVKRPNHVDAMAQPLADIFCGTDHVIARTTEAAGGEVYSWGRSDSGQCGHGEYRHESLPRPIDALSGEKRHTRRLFVGQQHSVALTEHGELLVWGSNSHGQLGIPGVTRVNIPQTVAAMRRSHVLEVACGGAHTLVLTSSREVFSWGSGQFGQLGHGDGKDSTEPRRLHEMHGLDIKQLQAGENHSAALTSFGEVYTWGRGEFGVLGHGDARSKKTPSAIAALKSASTCVCDLVSGSDHMFGITYSNDVYCWGRNMYGQLGLGNLEDQFLPVHNTLLQEESEKYTELNFPGLPPPKMTRIYVGNYHSVAISDDGKYVMTWGRGELGQLGHQYSKSTSIPTVVKHLVGNKDRRISVTYVKAACGLNHTMVLTSNSKGCNLLAWGRGSYGQLGFGTGLPKMPQPLDLASTLPALFGGASITASSPKKQSKPNATAHGESKRPEDSRAQPTEKLDPAKAAALSVSRSGSCPPSFASFVVNSPVDPIYMSPPRRRGGPAGGTDSPGSAAGARRGLAGAPAPEELAVELRKSLTLPKSLQVHLG